MLSSVVQSLQSCNSQACTQRMHKAETEGFHVFVDMRLRALCSGGLLHCYLPLRTALLAHVIVVGAVHPGERTCCWLPQPQGVRTNAGPRVTLLCMFASQLYDVISVPLRLKVIASLAMHAQH